MPYCSQTDIEDLIGNEKLINLTDDAGLGEVNQAAMAQALASAAAEIDFYCAGRYSPLPFSPVPPLVKALAIDLTVYHLYKRRQGAPDEWQGIYNQTIKKLRDVAGGLGELNPAAPAAATVGQAALLGGGDRLFTRDSQK